MRQTHDLIKDNATLLHDQHPVREDEYLIHTVRHHQNRRAMPLRQPEQQAVRACEAASARRGRRTVRRLEAGSHSEAILRPRQLPGGDDQNALARALCLDWWRVSYGHEVERADAKCFQNRRAAEEILIGNFFASLACAFARERTPTSRMRIPYSPINRSLSPRAALTRSVSSVASRTPSRCASSR
jgi:hypothetical protein